MPDSVVSRCHPANGRRTFQIHRTGNLPSDPGEADRIELRSEHQPPNSRTSWQGAPNVPDELREGCCGTREMFGQQAARAPQGGEREARLLKPLVSTNQWAHPGNEIGPKCSPLPTAASLLDQVALF